LKILIKKSPRP